MKIGNLDKPLEFGRRTDFHELMDKKLPQSLWDEIIGYLPEGIREKKIKYLTIVRRMLECYLQITGFQFNRTMSARHENQRIVRLFIGALYHEKMLNVTMLYRHCHATALLVIAQFVPWLGDCGLKSSSVGLTNHIIQLRDAFSHLTLDQDAVRVWQGWSTETKSDKIIYWPLAGIYRTLGSDFTERLYQVLDEFHSGRAMGRLMPSRALFSLLVDEGSKHGSEKFLDPYYSAQFFQKLLIRHLQDGFKEGEGARYSSLATEWRNSFIYFANNYLIPSGLFAPPIGGIPRPLGGIVGPSQTNIQRREDGVEVKTKLLSDVPLYASDSQAIEILFKQIGFDLAVVRTWAQHSVNDTWEKYKARFQNAKLGIPVTLPNVEMEAGAPSKCWLYDSENPNRIKNAAASFALHGYIPNKDVNLSIVYGSPFGMVAESLGLPVAGTLLPFCMLLVIDHPVITQAFLETLVLYDENGIRVGLRDTDAGRYLVGYKARSGPMRAEQSVLLNEATSEIVDRILAVTAPLRDYLRKKGDPNWRFLLLSGGKGFGMPKPWRHRGDNSGQQCIDRLKQQFRAAGISEEDTERLVGRISVTTVRATTAVQTYLETHSVQEMAVALGHKEYSSRLLAHYLPDAIRGFFQERWIRIFQAGIIMEAMKDSPYLLEASGFQSMEQIHEFLQHNFMPICIEPEDARPHDDSKNEVLFRVNERILAFLVALHECVSKSLDQAGAKASYWSEIAAHLFAFIESDACHRHDIKEMLEFARKAPKSLDLGALIYE